MSVVEIRDKIQTKMQKQSGLEFIFYFGLLPALIIFPINFLINPNIDPMVFEIPYFYLPFGFLVFTTISMIFSFFGVLAILFILNIYISSSRKFTDSFITNDYVLNKMTKGIHSKLQKFRSDDFVIQIDEAKQGLQSQIDELKVSDLRKDKIIARQNQDIFSLKWENKKLKRENDKLKTKQKESEQLVGDSAQTNNNNENTQLRKFKDLDE